MKEPRSNDRARRRRRTRRVVVALATGGVIAAGALPSSPAAAFHVGEHEDITHDGMPFLRDAVYEDMAGEHLLADFTYMTNNAKHFDGCEFSSGTGDINDLYDDIVDELDPQNPDPWAAADDFGFLSHPAQDFYAHSNWVELGRSDLIDSGLGQWTELGDWVPLRDDIVVGQGETLPDGWTFTSSDGDLVPGVLTPDGPKRALISGINDSASDAGAVWPDDCHDDIEVYHSELTKDADDHPSHAVARALAVRQTEHEWCRLLHLLSDEYGAAGAALPLTLWTGPQASPHPASTPCAPAAAGSVPVTVTPTAMHVIESTDDFGGELNFVFGLYTTDLQRSARAEVGPLFYGDDEDVAKGELPPALTLCVGADEPVAVTMQGWDDDELGATDGVYNDMPAYEDETLRGPTFTLDPGFQAGDKTVSFGDLTVSYTVSSTAVDADSDGLDQCAEAAAGTLPDDPDTDDDGLSDGDEVHTYGTDATKADTDSDGLSDGDEVHTYGTDPNLADSDGDLISDGDEVLIYGTDPLEGDSDGDGLSDGEEIQLYGTDPNLPDTDGDGLDDLIEVTYGSNPNVADSDGDGLVDGSDVEFVEHAVDGIPAGAFKPAGDGSRTAVLAILEDVEASLLNGKEAVALQKLRNLRTRVDGCGTTADGNDWIIDCDAQTTIRSLIDVLMANIAS